MRRNPVDIELYAVGASGRVNLGDLVKDVKYVTVTEHVADDGTKDGTLIVSPVRVVPATGKRTALDEDQPLPGI
jgi:hypothetical protein